MRLSRPACSPAAQLDGIRLLEGPQEPRQRAQGDLPCDRADAAEKALTAFEAGPWGQRYPAIGQSSRRAWGEVIPFFAFPGEVRRIIYTTNAIEALNSKLRRAVRARGHFPSDEAATKLLYLILNRSEKEWKMPPCGWTMAKAQLP
jgi:putative transposase